MTLKQRIIADANTLRPKENYEINAKGGYFLGVRDCLEIINRHLPDDPSEEAIDKAFTSMYHSLQVPLITWYKAQGCSHEHATAQMENHCAEIVDGFRQAFMGDEK